jgi:hypothetical protein
VGFAAASEHARWLALSTARREGVSRTPRGRGRHADLPPMRIHAFDPASDRALCGWREVTRLNIHWTDVDIRYRCARCRFLSE